MKRVLFILFAIGAVFATADTAEAKCHLVSVKAEPKRVEEGGRVTVTVHRDGVDGESSFDVKSEDGSADEGDDFTPLDNELNWVINGPQTATYPILITDDGMAEGDETFSVKLSNGGGCVREFDPESAAVTIEASTGAKATGGGSSLTGLFIGAALVAVAIGWFALRQRG